MALQESTTDISQEFDALNIEESETLQQTWANAEQSGSSPAFHPRSIGHIPALSLGRPNNKTSQKFAFLRNAATRQACLLVSVFGLGCLTFPIGVGIVNLTSHSSHTDSVVELDSTTDEGVPTPVTEVTSKESKVVSIKFDDFTSDDYDDLYGSGLTSDPSTTILTSDLGDTYDSFGMTPNAEEDAFPTWADLAPRPSEEFLDSSTNSYASDYESQFNDDSLPNRNEIAVGTDTSAFERSVAQNSVIAQTESESYDATANQGFQNFQAFSTLETSRSNNYDYNDNANYSNFASTNPSTENVKYVDDTEESDYNNYQSDNGYSRNSVAQDQSALMRSSANSSYAEQVQARYSESDVSTYDAYSEEDEEESTPTYASSIPTFSNPHPERNANSRQAYVAQNYENKSSKKASSQNNSAQAPKSGRSVRW